MDPASPPPDPRLSHEVPSFGDLPTQARLDEVTIRVIAPNPSPMTLDGTNTYVVGEAAAGQVVIIDPGPDDPDHLERVTAAVGDRGVRAIVTTHHHVDHAAAAASWARGFGCALVATTEEVAGARGQVLRDGDRLDLPGLEVTAVATPGHCRDHVAFRIETGALLTGDHVLGRGTSVVAHPDGDLTSYLDSLRRTLELGPDALYPGHGPEMTSDPRGVIAYYLAHREFRQQQVIDALRDGPRTPRQIVKVVYADVSRILWPAAKVIDVSHSSISNS